MKRKYIPPLLYRIRDTIWFAIKKIFINYIFFIAIILVYKLFLVNDTFFIISTYLWVLNTAYLWLTINIYDTFKWNKKFIFYCTLFIFIVLILLLWASMINTLHLSDKISDSNIYINISILATIIYLIFEFILSYYDEKIENEYFEKISKIDNISEDSNEKKNNMVLDVVSLVIDNKKE